MNPFEMVVLIVAIVAIAGVARAKYRVGRDAMGNDVALDADSGDVERLRAELRSLKDRVATLERIATDQPLALDREIERLRDR